MIYLWIFTLLFLAAYILLAVYIDRHEKEDRINDGGYDPGAAIQQYREWKSQASSYSEMEEWNDAIDEERKKLRGRRWGW